MTNTLHSIDDLLTVVVERNASDLHLTAGSPPVIRVTGRLERLPDYEELTPEQIRTLMYRILSTEQQKVLETRRQIDFSHSIPGLARFRVVQTVTAGHVYASARTSYGKSDLDLVAPRSVGRAVFTGRPLVERIVAPMGVDLPVRKGQELGEVRVYERGKLVARSPLVAARSIDEPGAAARAGWYVKRSAHNMLGWVS